ncbi:mitochondrial potassium channel-like [Entelurus aequoreus]|uniref:mitochondrial potassium channel-like n=1 Tax=Entelurus aequoreus TaxID=161455 RepID=UPI002B1D4B8B|nr:mitochondrial potassium channel-like [Entelurus aequoreus]XP_061894035.1 mitochondrial potassium channel-like [Entelurus aequoreus]
MRYRGHGSCCLSRLFLLGPRPDRMCVVRGYSAQHRPSGPGRPDGKDGPESAKERALSALQHAGQLGHQWGQRSAQMATAAMNRWWERYEEFVGLNEVRGAQANVTEAEAAFMVSRGMVREAHGSLETLQARLKEVRDRLDRVSREEAHYLELATLEHKLLQEERRLRTAYEHAEGSEREKFASFSAAVRESHEKERTRAERTKNWSVIGSVLGALIGVMGSTYVNRVRLQELKSLLLEAQKGPESLQEALKVQAGNHRSQQDELRALIDSLRVTLKAPLLTRASAVSPSPSSGEVRRTESPLQSQVGQLQQGLGKVQSDLSLVRSLLESAPQRPVRIETADRPGLESMVQTFEDTQRTLGERVSRSTLYNAAFTYTAAAITVSAVYALLRGGA